MSIHKLKHSQIFLTVLQGLFLLVILSTLFSVCINLVLTGFSDDMNSLNMKIAERQDLLTENDTDSLEEFSAASAELEKYKEEAGSMRLLAAIMYAALALFFLLKAMITRCEWRPNLFRYGIGCMFFAACTVIFLFRDSAKAYGLAAALHAAALIAVIFNPAYINFGICFKKCVRIDPVIPVQV